MSYLADFQLTASIRTTLSALAGVVCPAHALDNTDLTDIVAHVELAMRAASATVRTALVAGLHTYELAAVLLPTHGGRRASALSERKAQRYFHSWWHSKLLPRREFAKGIKGLLCLACYEQTGTQEALGYTAQDWLDKSTHYRLKTFQESIARSRLALFSPDPLPGIERALHRRKGHPHES